MYKIFLIILAIVVSELAVSHNQSKIVDNCIFDVENQCSKEFKWITGGVCGY
jgi:hypothetical protein